MVVELHAAHPHLLVICCAVVRLNQHCAFGSPSLFVCAAPLRVVALDVLSMTHVV